MPEIFALTATNPSPMSLAYNREKVYFACEIHQKAIVHAHSRRLPPPET
jgi:hypothetical protein